MYIAIDGMKMLLFGNDWGIKRDKDVEMIINKKEFSLFGEIYLDRDIFRF